VRLLLATTSTDNVLGAQATGSLAAGGGTPVDGVLIAGDVTDFGLREEARIFVRAFGDANVRSSSWAGTTRMPPAMAALERAGFVAAGARRSTVGGVLVAGADDPLARSPLSIRNRLSLAIHAASLAVRLEMLDPKPQVVLVHDLSQASDVVGCGQAGRRAVGRRLRARPRRRSAPRRSVILVDAGTAGASGYGPSGRLKLSIPGRQPPPVPDCRQCRGRSTRSSSSTFARGEAPSSWYQRRTRRPARRA